MPQLMPLNWMVSFCIVVLILISGVVMYSLISKNIFSSDKMGVSGMNLDWWW